MTMMEMKRMSKLTNTLRVMSFNSSCASLLNSFSYSALLLSPFDTLMKCGFETQGSSGPPGGPSDIFQILGFLVAEQREERGDEGGLQDWRLGDRLRGESSTLESKKSSLSRMVDLSFSKVRLISLIFSSCSK